MAFDDDDGGAKWREIARGARLRGVAVDVLDAEAYGGLKDVAAAWETRALRLVAPDHDAEERDAIRDDGAGDRS